MAVKSDWEGRVGQEWARRVTDMETWLGPPGRAGLATLGPIDGLDVIDIGCGAGATSRAMVAKGARVTGVDVSPDLLDVATAAGGEVSYRLADASADDLGGPYDALFSRFGAMFFDDPVAGWRHIRGHMKPGAKGVIVAWKSWEKNHWTSLPAVWMSSVLGEEATAPSPGGVPGPFAWGEEAYAREILEEAGWSNIVFDDWREYNVVTMGDDPDPLARAAKATMTISPLASRLKDVSDDQKAGVRAALMEGFADHMTNGRVQMRASVWLIKMTA